MIITETNSSMSFALTQLAMPMAIFLLLPFVGPVTDKYDRKKVIVISQLISILSLIFYFLFFGFFENKVVLMTILLIFTLKGCDIFVTNSFSASIVNLVQFEDVSKLRGYQQTGISLSSLAAPVLGAALYGVLPFNYFVLFEAITECVALVVSITINFHYNKKENFVNKAKSSRALFVEGIKFMGKQKYLLGITVFSAAINFLFASINVGLPIIMLVFLNSNNFEYSIVSTSFIVGLMVSGMIFVKKKESKFLLLDSWRALVIMGFLYILFSPISLLVDSSGMATVLYSILYFFCGFTVSFVNIPFSVWISKNVPNEMQGRVNSVETALSLAVLPIGLILYGELFNLESKNSMLLSAMVFLISGIVYLLFMIIITRVKKLDFKKGRIL